VTTSDPADAGRRRADEYLALVAGGDDEAADALLATLGDVRELVYLGAALTAIARAEGRRLPTPPRTQASTRQVHLGQFRDSQRGDLDGLRTWLRRSADEILIIRSLHAAAGQGG
jgi:hypothetical protein